MKNFHTIFRLFPLTFSMLLVVLLGFAGCKTNSNPSTFDQTDSASVQTNPSAGETNSEAIILREGDVLNIFFPDSANLNTSQQIRRDGKITLPLVGEVKAAGITPEELQQNLIKLYGPQLSTKQVLVQIESSSFPIFVSGAVLHPGKIIVDHQIMPLEAIMEAGGFDNATANMKKVKVIREKNGQVKDYIFNLKNVLDGKQNESFYLEPSDIIYVPEKFSWF